MPATYVMPSPTGCVKEMWVRPCAAARVAIDASARIDLIIFVGFWDVEGRDGGWDGGWEVERKEGIW